MTTPVLSIVLPTCDRPDTLEVCLRTFASQPNPKIEIIIQDNACDERTIDIINTAQEIDPRIVHCREEQRVSMRYNFEKGVAAATGDYISLIGDDDAFCAGALDWLVKMAEEHNPLAIRWTLAAFNWNSLSDGNLGFFDINYGHFYGGWAIKDAKELTKAMLSGEMEGLWQSLQIYHGAVSRKLYEETKSQTEDIFFRSHIPDPYVHSAMLLVAAEREDRDYIEVHHPLSIYGMSGHSNGNSWLTKKSEERGEASPIAAWEKTAAADTQVKLQMQHGIKSVKYQDYFALMLAVDLGLHKSGEIDHENWVEKIVEEVRTNPWQFSDFTEATPIFEFEKEAIKRVLDRLSDLRDREFQRPARLKRLRHEWWQWQQVCNFFVEPDLPDDVETAVIVLDQMVDNELGLRSASAISDEEKVFLRNHLREQVKGAYDFVKPSKPTLEHTEKVNAG